MTFEFSESSLQETEETTLKELSNIPDFFKDLPDASEETDSPIVRENTSNTYIITRNESLENDVHPITGVAFEKETIVLPNDETIEGVFPKFPHVYEAALPEDLYLQDDRTQFKECNAQLYQSMEQNPVLKAQFTKIQIEQTHQGISNGTTANGYVWHHDSSTGKMQLVDSEIHEKTGHTGGRSLWGGGNLCR